MNTEPAAPPANARILVVEDNPLNRKLLLQQLACLDHDCDAVSHGGEALAQLQQQRYQLVLCDWHMPVMDGPAFAHALRALPGPNAKLPLIALTGKHPEEGESFWRDAGFDDCLAKPVTLKDLQAKLEVWLQVSSQGPDEDEQAPAAALPTDWGGLPVFDPQVLPEMIDHDEALVRSLSADFLAQCRPQCDAMLASAQAQDWTSLAMVAHQLASSARFVGGLQLGQLCKDLEKAGTRASSDPAAVQALLPHLLPTCQALCVAMAQHLR